MAILSWKTTDGKAGEWTLDHRPCRIGRAEGNDQVIPDQSVSSVHAEVRLDQGNLRLKDLGSTNGTFFFDQRVNEVLVEPGQTFRLGNAIVTYQAAEAPQPASATTVPPAPAPAPIPIPARISPALHVAHAPIASTPAQVAAPLAADPNLSSSSTEACALHSAAPAVYTCTKCQKNLCADCAKLERIGPKTFPFCLHCGGKCVPLGQPLVAVKAPRQSFGKMLPGAFSYPFKGNGIILLLTGTLFFGFLDAITSRLGLTFILSLSVILVKVITYGYLFAYMQKIVHSSAEGEKDPPGWPEVTDISQDIYHPFWLFFGTVVASFAPGFLVYLFLNPLAGDFVILLGMLYFPMALLAVAMADSLAGLNPVVVASAILKVPGPYLVAALFCGGLLFARTVLPGIFKDLDIPVIPFFVLAFFSLFLITIEMRILGILYYTNKEKIGWF
jgi:hypothetical protein